MREKILCNRNTTIIIRACQFSITAILLFCLLFIIVVARGDYSNIRDKLSKHSLFSSIIIERDRVKARAEFVTLNHFIPNFEFLIAFINHLRKTA